ncbi:MAG: hypothetical protein OEY01_12215 [Desulfobulbaceae bacterium]|nr:hypothetical protein [Desulfobulbaceae bacterium]
MRRAVIIMLMTWAQFFGFWPAHLAQAETGQLSIFYSNDVRGETEPCG